MTNYAVQAIALTMLIGMPSGVADAQTPPLHVIRIASGPSGVESKGTFVFSEERSIFSAAHDREIIVLFQWDGLPGPHKLVAQWRSPDGGLTSTSAIDYIATERRFGAYWRLPVSPSMPSGTWSIDVTVDGQPAGRSTFKVRAEKVESAPVRRPYTTAELYERVNRVFVVVERSAGEGRPLDAMAGFLVGSGRVYTAMSAIDAATNVHALLPDSSRRQLTSVVAWNRPEGWAVLEPGSPPELPLPVAAADTLRVGDRCFSLEGSTGGGRVLVEFNVTGQVETPSGRRFLLAVLNGTGTAGAPIVNEFGELVGMLGGANLAGATRLYDLLRYRGELRGIPVIPPDAIITPENASAQPIAELHRRGELAPPLTGDGHIISGGFASDIIKSPVVAPLDQRTDFSVQEKELVTFVTWNARTRVRGMALLQVRDARNRLVAETKPNKVDVRKGRQVLAYWRLPVPRQAGFYRVDLLIDGAAIWREFVRVTP
jgi:hypothetical protein